MVVWYINVHLVKYLISINLAFYVVISGQYISRIYSVHDNYREDRRFKFECREGKGEREAFGKICQRFLAPSGAQGVSLSVRPGQVCQKH